MQEIGFIGLVLLKSSKDADENDRSDAKRRLGGVGWGQLKRLKPKNMTSSGTVESLL